MRAGSPLPYSRCSQSAAWMINAHFLADKLLVDFEPNPDGTEGSKGAWQRGEATRALDTPLSRAIHNHLHCLSLMLLAQALMDSGFSEHPPPSQCCGLVLHSSPADGAARPPTPWLRASPGTRKRGRVHGTVAVTPAGSDNPGVVHT